jgi:hypothetical protein
MASRVLWEHGLTPKEAVNACFKTMEPQIDRALGGMTSEDDDTSEPIASFIAPPSPNGAMPPIWEDDGDDDDANDIPAEWLPRDPRGSRKNGPQISRIFTNENLDSCRFVRFVGNPPFATGAV